MSDLNEFKINIYERHQKGFDDWRGSIEFTGENAPPMKEFEEFVRFLGYKVKRVKFDEGSVAP